MSETKPLLPQYDPDRQARQEKLAETREQIVWCHDYLKPVSVVYLEGGSSLGALQRLRWVEVGIIDPLRDLGLRYAARRAASVDKVVANSAETRKDGKASAYTSFDQYAQLFKAMPRPAFVDTWSQDGEFAYQRLGGVNPLTIHRIDAVPDGFAITDERLSGLLRPGETLASEGRAGRLYLCDYSILEGLESASDASGTRSVVPVLALFHVDAGDPRGPRLAPLAIQIGLDARPSAVYTPRDGKAWTMAKICVQCADAACHEMGPHLLGTHFMEETFCVAFVRQLSPSHPVYRLLFPHFYELLLNNVFGRKALIDPGGSVDELMGGTVETSLRILQRTYEGYPSRGVPPWSFEAWDLPLSLAARGAFGIPDYPYRDDGLLVWGAIRRFVAAYVNIYYASDADVLADDEIQAWARDLTDPEGGHVRGVPRAIEGVEALVAILTRIVFACGPLHAALNYAQYDAMAFVPNMPLALYATPPDDARALGEEALSDFIMKLLPPPDKAASQLETIEGLTSLRFGELGRYEDGHFTDPPALTAVQAFQQDLAAIEAEIERRNRDRQLRGLREYRYLLPSLIPPSTSM
jgi:arachidonate 15-lipoxygenase